MTDLLLEIHDDGADLKLEAGDLALDHTLATPALVSLFSDRRAGDDILPPDGTEDPRGWWGEDPNDPFGSLLWLLTREKATNEVLARAQTYSKDALGWLEREGIAQTVEAFATFGPDDMLQITVTMQRGHSQSARHADLWEATEAADFSAGRFSLKLIPI